MVRLTRKRLVIVVVAAALLIAGGGYAVHRAARFDLAATARRLDALTIRITGSAAELRANELLSYHRVEGGTAACMRERGQPWRIRPYVSYYQDFTDADLGYGDGWAGVLDSVTHLGRRVVRNAMGSARMPDETSPEKWHLRPGDDVTAWVAASNACRERYEHRDYHDTDPPVGAYDLVNLPGLLGPIAAHPTVLAAALPYSPCMAARGHTVGWDGRDDFLVRNWDLRREEAPIDGRPAGPGWVRAEAELTALYRDDAECRMPAYTAAMRLLSWRLDDWEAEHREQLDRIRADWERRLAEAARLPTEISLPPIAPRPSPGA
ncbi:hypothetical protein ACFQO7_06510 [Catellatospora aurea]|uniref:Uncharacterized protein n=1 Tax=Catellatospora aurea TaxID=1337874 RepID=A0ABW2GQ27_9ACTN